MKLLATLLIRNEAEMVADCLDHHLREGVSGFLITDHSSTDELADVLQPYRHVICHFHQETDERYLQDIWVTRMARQAIDFRPDWIVHLDADERWHGLNLLKHIPKEYAWIKTGAWRNHLPLAETLPVPFQSHMMPYYEIPGRTGSSQPRYVDFGTGTGGKVIHRPEPAVQIGLGNHTLQFPDRPMLFCDGIEVHHYPIRSLSQFRRKVETGTAAIEAAQWAPCAGAHWRNWRELDRQGLLGAVFRKFMLTEEEIQIRMAAGTLFHGPTTSR